MNTFATVTDNLVKLLSGTFIDPVGVARGGCGCAYARTRWGSSLSVKKTFKPRVEVNLSDFPLIMITRPDLTKISLINAPRDAMHTVRFYCGFHQPDRDLAQDDLVAFEEAIDDDLLSTPPEYLGAVNIRPLKAVNDEGWYHPVYFMVIDAEVYHRRIA